VNLEHPHFQIPEENRNTLLLMELWTDKKGLRGPFLVLILPVIVCCIK